MCHSAILLLISALVGCSFTHICGIFIMATEQIQKEYYESSKLAKYPFEPYWPEKKLRICVTGGETRWTHPYGCFLAQCQM